MKIGYIHNSAEAHKRAMQVIKLTAEPQALDELGIGRIRDAFADKLFPGISTLQKRLKYFSLMPQVYRKAVEKGYGNINESERQVRNKVRKEVIRLEIEMTRRLYENSPEGERNGITGSSMKGEKFVKYDPAYIYHTGLLKYGILRDPDLYGAIARASEDLKGQPRAFRSDDEDVNDDAGEKTGNNQFCEYPKVDYDFLVDGPDKFTIDLTPEDKSFILEHMKAGSRGSLLNFLLDIVDKPGFVVPQTFRDIAPFKKDMPEDMRLLYDKARRFSDFMYVIHLRYNCIFSEKNCPSGVDQKILSKFEEELDTFMKSGTDIRDVLYDLPVREQGCLEFCKAAAGHLAASDLNGLDRLIIDREARVKTSRKKIGTPGVPYRPVHYHRLTYRWETVHDFLGELKKVNNG